MDSLVIEISVLTVPKIMSVESSEEYLSKIKIGRDGVIIDMDGLSAVFLPQVPVEFRWDVREYLRELCNKASLPEDAWKNPKAKIYMFQADVFSED